MYETLSCTRIPIFGEFQEAEKERVFMLCFALRYSRRIVCSTFNRIRMLSSLAGTGSGSPEAASALIESVTPSASLSKEGGMPDASEPYNKPLFTKEEMCS